MARKNIEIPLDRQNRNDVNHNFKELYDDFRNVVDKVAKEAFDQVIDGSKINWDKMVDSVDDLPTDAKEGDARGVKSDNKIYRYDGSNWIDIAEISLNPISEVDDRLSSKLREKVNYQELEEVDRKIQGVNGLAVSNAIHNWWVYPVAVRYSDLKNKTYFTRVSSTGGVRVASIDHDNGMYEESLLGTVSADDHNTAAISMPPKGTIQPIFIFWAGHNDEKKVFFRSSKEHESISDLGETRTLTTSGDASYAQVLRRGNRIIVFTRVKPDRKWVYFVSDNAGESWSNEKTFLESGPNHDWVYMTVQNRADNTNDVRIAVTEHPTVGEKHNVYFMTLKITTGDVIRHNDGGGSELIANIYEENNLPLVPENLAIVHEAKEGETTRLFAVGGASTTEFAIGSFNKGERNALYKYVYWDNGPKTIDLIDSGPPIERPGESNYYFPGMSLSGTFEPGIVYVAREENLTRYLEKWILKGDDTWDVRLIRKSTEDKVFRPISVLNGSKYELIWSEGRYTTFRDFDTKQILMESINGTKDVSSINKQEVGSVPVNYRYTESPNGSYKIYDDGTIECWHKIKLIYNSAQRLRGNWDLPIPLEKVHFVGSKCGGTSDITPNARDLAYNQVLEDGKDRVIVYQYRQDGGEDFEAGDELDCYVYVSGIWKV